MNRRTKFDTFTRARSSVFAVLAVAALGLTACGGDADGEPGSSASPATSAVAAETATPSATPKYKPASADGPAENVPLPKMPSEASLKSQQGLEAFIPYWFETMSYAYETGDLDPVRSVTDSECSLCAALSKDIENWTLKGRWIVGGQLEVTEVEDRFVETTAGNYAPYVFATQEPLAFYANNALQGKAEGIDEPLLWIATATFDDGSWVMVDLRRPEGATE